MLDSTLEHLTAYAALARMAANAGEILVNYHCLRFLILQPHIKHMIALTYTTPDNVFLRMAWQVRPKHHVYHHLGLDMRAQLYSCRYYHCFRDEAGMKYGKRCYPQSSGFSWYFFWPWLLK